MIHEDFNLANGTYLKVMDDGSIDISGLKSYFDEKQNFLRAIWQMYKAYSSNDRVIRSGHLLCGVYNHPGDNYIMDDYIESDTVHSTSVEELANNVFIFYPNLLCDYDKKRVIRLLRYHDLGESVDCPDDGSRPHDLKFEEEFKTFSEKIYSLPLQIQEKLLKDFYIFEHANLPIWSDDDRIPMQIAKLNDKTDAPLKALLYEAQGRPGSLLYKKKHYGKLSDQDRDAAIEIGTFAQADIWTAHFIDSYHDFENFWLFIGIIAEACRDVRGGIFPWAKDFCVARGINEGIIKILS